MNAACPACVAAPLAQEVAGASAQQFSLPSIHCIACISKIDHALNTLTGVGTHRVNLSLKRLTVSGPVPPETVLKTLADLGFEAYPLDVNTLKAGQDAAGVALLTRMSVAGFAMMNVMLFSVSIWSGATDATRDFFHLLSALIALPVIAYSAQPFFENAWRAVRVGRLNMDVPISLAILLASAMSLFETLNGGAHAYFDAALSLTFFLLIGRYLDHRTRSAARSAAKELSALEVHTAERLVEGLRESVPLDNVAIGDEILIPSGARVCVDGVLISDSALMDRAFLTGETAAISRQKGDTLQAGEINLAAPLSLRATAVGQDTSLRRMAALVETAENGRNSYTALADRAAQIYAPAVHLLAALAFVAWFGATQDARHALNIAIAVLIITCPCALGLAVPAVSTAAISRLFSAGFLVKHATALERLADVDHAVFDKTGTLSQPAIHVPKAMSETQKSVARGLAQTSNHPTSIAITKALTGVTPATVTDIEDLPGRGVFGTWNGRPVRLARGPLLGAAFDGVGVQIDDAPAVAFEQSEALRAGVQSAVGALDIACEIVTGDAAGPAQKLAALLGLPVKAGARPEDKLAHLEQLRTSGSRVLMVGDGLNDTAALAAAHASIAPARALDAARSAADVVILQDDMSKLPLVLRIARTSQRLCKQNFAIAACYNLIAVPVALAGFATPLAAALAMSLSSITVILNSQRIRSVT